MEALLQHYLHNNKMQLFRVFAARQFNSIFAWWEQSSLVPPVLVLLCYKCALVVGYDL